MKQAYNTLSSNRKNFWELLIDHWGGENQATREWDFDACKHCKASFLDRLSENPLCFCFLFPEISQIRTKICSLYYEFNSLLLCQSSVSVW